MKHPTVIQMRNIRIIILVIIGLLCLGLLVSPVLGWSDLPGEKVAKFRAAGIDATTAQSMAEDSTEQFIAMLEAEGHKPYSMSLEEVRQLCDEIVDSIDIVEQNDKVTWKFKFHASSLGLLEYSDGKLTKVPYDPAVLSADAATTANPGLSVGITNALGGSDIDENECITNFGGRPNLKLFLACLLFSDEMPELT